MTEEEKQLLLKDLCARLPYRVKVQAVSVYGYTVQVPIDGYCSSNNKFDIDLRWRTLDEFKPYLRPMSSMTQEEIDEYDAELDKDMDIVMNGALDKDRYITSGGKHNFSKNFVMHFGNDWLNKKGFDYRGLIPMGLALEAPEDMYKTEQI